MPEATVWKVATFVAVLETDRAPKANRVPDTLVLPELSTLKSPWVLLVEVAIKKALARRLEVVVPSVTVIPLAKVESSREEAPSSTPQVKAPVLTL